MFCVLSIVAIKKCNSSFHLFFSLPIVRTGLNLLVILCTHAHYSPDHKLHVEHEFTELIYKSMNLFKNIRPYMPELEGECQGLVLWWLDSVSSFLKLVVVNVFIFICIFG
jgi:hypothetical protein